MNLENQRMRKQTVRTALVGILDQIIQLRLRHKSPVGLQHVEYNAYKFLPYMAKCYIEMFAFFPLFKQIFVESSVSHSYQSRSLQDSPAQVG